ncbi:MAG: serine protease Do [Candidatus Krumholzibacteriia bacterium]
MRNSKISFLISLFTVVLILNITAPAAAQEQEWSINKFSEEVRDLTGRVNPAVVQIYTSSFGALAGSVPQGAALFGQQMATGSGVILDPNGYIITNNHVVRGAKRVRVRLSAEAVGAASGNSILSQGGKMVGAQVIGFDLETDLAVLKIDMADLPHLALGDSDQLFQGQLVFAFGSPLGLTNSVSFGIVSTVARQLERDNPMIYVQTDVAINPGNSGGPLVNFKGEVVGINTLIMTQGGGSEGLSFSAPSNIVKNVFNQIRATGRVKRGVIGVHPQTVNPWISKALGLSVDWGVIIGDVYPEGPADKARLQIGDVVLSIDGKQMENARQFEVNLYGKAIGSKIDLEVARGSSTSTISVEVVERIEPDYRFYDMISTERNMVHKIGILALDLDKKTSVMLPSQPRSAEGVIVAALAADVNLLGEKFMPGDIIYKMNGVSVKGLRSLKKMVKETTFGDPVVFHLERNGRLRYLVMEME